MMMYVYCIYILLPGIISYIIVVDEFASPYYYIVLARVDGKSIILYRYNIVVESYEL